MYGRKVPRLIRWDVQASREALTGGSLYSFGPINRFHCPAEGGESLHTVALRAEAIIRSVLEHGINLSEAPEFFLEKKTTHTPTILPDGIPHVVIVSHIFLIELYEKLKSWGKEYSQTRCDYKNTEW
jgi:hypothetical protein